MAESPVELVTKTRQEEKNEKFGWRTNLKSHRWVLEKCLDPRPVVDILHKQEVISSLEKETLTEVDRGTLGMMVNRLVSLLVKKEDATFEAFCKACKDTGQKHILGLIHDTHDDECKPLIPAHKKKLSLLLDILPTLKQKQLRELLGFLEVNKVLQSYERQEIQNEGNQQVKGVLLVLCLLRKPDWCFVELIRVIEVIGLHEVASKLRPQSSDSFDVPPESPGKESLLLPSSSQSLHHVYEPLPQDKNPEERQPLDILSRIKSLWCCSLLWCNPRVELELCTRDRVTTVFPWDIVSLSDETLVIRDLKLSYIQQIDSSGYVLNIFDINEPISCVATYKNFVYVASCSGIIYKFDSENIPGRILKTIKPEGVGLICSMAVPETNCLVLCDKTRNEIVEYDENSGKSRTKISGLQGMKYISVMESMQDRLYFVSVCDSEHCVNIYSGKWHLLLSVGEEGSEDGMLLCPYAITMASSDTFLVSDTWNHRVSEFDLEGNFVRHVLDGRQKISYPKGVSLIGRQLWVVARDSQTDMDMIIRFKIKR